MGGVPYISERAGEACSHRDKSASIEKAHQSIVDLKAAVHAETRARVVINPSGGQRRFARAGDRSQTAQNHPDA